MLFLLHLILFLIPSPTLLSHSVSVPSESQSVKMVISEQCVSDPNEVQGREIDLIPGSPLVLTHRIHLVPGSASGSCCQSEFGALRERIEGLEREVSDLRQKCGGVDGGCCTSQQSKGLGCTTSTDECLNDCSDQGSCVDGKCVCFPGFSGPDCSVPDCPGNCSKKGKCISGKCVCDQGFTGPDCSVKTCPKNCSSHGRCVNGRCVCNTGFTGPDCSERSCPRNCNNKGRCVNGKCVCDTGFAGPDCSERSCPGNCNNKGRCVNGKCVCDTGFAGPDCSERSCPGNCNNKGRCVNGKCVCDTGFAGPDCSERSCPGNCNNKGRCVNGKCVCDTGFAGPDCSERSCPGNCNNKGRCVDGKCVCDTGFTGPDCSEKTCPGNCNNKGRCENGKCVCDTGFAGLDCSEKSCPGNCNNKGRCVNGKCVCDTGFTGPECSEKTCPGNCNNKGRCVNGKCVCDTGFTGRDCSERSCPGNCNNKGRCVNGKCVCDTGFTGPDCSEKSCPGNCNNKGRCVNGQCVCEVGFTGPDCSTKSCPNNCSNRGRCVNGKCVCNPGFAEPDCSECKDEFTGPDCTTALIAVSHFGARNITESSVTLFWTPPIVQYNTYHITFTSEKESDQNITATVNGRLISYNQVGLAPGQRYTVTIVGEKDGKMGSKSMTTFQTFISGPKNLQVVKTSTTSVIVQWEEAQGEIDRYLLSISPNQTDGSGKKSQEMRLPPGRDSAQIDGLEPGRLYDISLVAVKDDTQSLPANVQATPDRVAGFSDKVRPLDGNGPKLQDGRLEKYPIKERQEENKVIHQQEEGALEMAKLSEHPKRISVEEMEAGTTPSPSLPLATTLVPSEIQKQHTNSGQATSRYRPYTKTSLQLPPSFKYRYSSRPKVSGSSTSLINSRQSTASISSTNSSQMPEYKILSGNVSSLQASYPLGMGKETIKMKTTASKESQPGDQGLLTRSHQGQDRDSSVVNIPESIKDTVNRANGVNLPKHKETVNKTAPLYHHTPHRGTFPRRSNIGPFQNRTSPSQHRRPLRRPLLPRVNITASIKGEPVIMNRRQSVLNPNHTQVLTWQRKNGTVIRFPPKPINKIKPNLNNDKGSKADATLDKNTSKESNIFLPEDNDANPIFNLSLSIDKSLSKKDDTMQPVNGSSESTIDHILPSITNRDSTTGQIVPRHQRVSGVFRGRQNVSSLKIRPTFIQIRKNNTVIRLPTNLRTEENVTTSNVYSLLKDSKYESRHKHAKDPKKESRIGLPTDADINLFDTITVSTEKPPIGTNQTLQTINEGSQNTIDHTNKEHTLHRLTTRYQNLSRVTNRDHNLPRVPLRDLEISKMQTMQTIIDQNVGSEIIGQRENVPNQNLRSKYILRRKDGTIVRFQPKHHTQIKPNFTRIHSGLKEADAKVVKDAKESVTLTTDRHTAERYYEPKTAAVNTDVGNDNILPSVTNRGQDLSRNTNRDHHVSRVTKDQDLLSNTNREDSTTIKQVNNQNGPSETFGGEENVPNQNLSPTFMQSNSDRFQPKLHDQIKLNSSTIQSVLIPTEVRAEKGSKESTAITVPAVGVASEGDTKFNSTGQNPTFTTKFTMRKNNGTVFRHKLKPKLKPKLHGDPKLSTESNSTKITSPQNTINHNSRPNISLQRKTGSNIRLPPKVFPRLRPESTTIHDVTGRSKNATDDPKLGWSTEGPLSTDKATSQRNTTFPPLSEDNINHVKIQNVTSKGFIIIWVAPEGRFKNFVIRIIEEIDEEVNEGVGSKQEERKDRTEGNEISSNVIEVVRRNSSIVEVRKKFIKLLPGSARLYPVTDLSSQTNYSVTLYGTGPGIRSNIHTFIITTGPEPPSHLSFTDITDTSLTVSWRRPKSSVSGFKVTYIHTKEGEPISVMVDSSRSTLSLTKLSPGSPYEVSVISVLGLDESDAIKDMVITMPDPPTNLRAINITDSKALLVWRPALATVDQYIITYEAPGSELSIKVSGNAVEQQLQTLKSSTKYSVNIVSQLGDQKSSGTHTTFITTSGSPGKGEAPRDLTAKHVTARTALLSWKPPASAVTSYKLTYFIKGGERKEVTLNAGVSEHKLGGLRPSSTYTALLQGERGGVYTAAISTDFTTETLRFPYPSDCSQELLNGELKSGLVEIFPGGKDGKPVMVYCDMETDGGGWTVFQRRKDGKTNFFRGWQEYRKGFGDLEGEFWLGNDFLHILTTTMPMTMRVDLRSENEAVFAHYSTFSVDTMKKHYMLRLSGYSGTAGDSLRYHDKRPFSTHDRDPQPFITRCAMSYRGGWWYKNCHEANLNGLYNTHTNHQGVIWTAWKGKTYSIPFAEMKLRPASFKSHSQG